MTPTVLLEELAAYLKSANEEYFLTDERYRGKEITVQPGFLKKKQSADESQFPYIVPRFMKSTDDNDGSTVTVRIYFGTHSEDIEHGWREVMSLMENSRLALLKKQTIAKRFRLQLPLTMELTEDQPYPEWVGYMTAVYTLPMPVEELNFMKR